jgi:hypothetical protein
MNSVEVDLTYCNDPVIGGFHAEGGVSTTDMLLALEGLKSKSDKTYRSRGNIYVDRNLFSALSMVLAF